MKNNFLIVLIVICFIWIYNLKSDINDLEEQVDHFSGAYDNCSYQIKTAKYSTWGSCSEMRSALESLNTEL